MQSPSVIHALGTLTRVTSNLRAVPSALLRSARCPPGSVRNLKPPVAGGFFLRHAGSWIGPVVYYIESSQ